MGTEARVVALVCAAEILGLAGFSLVPALLPQFIATWSLSNTEAGWLAGMMSGGYMLGVLPLVALTDRIPARTIFLICSALSALSSFGMALSDSLPPALVWRAWAA
jgi:predicted MFS family arabinose efflux permease